MTCAVDASYPSERFTDQCLDQFRDQLLDHILDLFLYQLLDPDLDQCQDQVLDQCLDKFPDQYFCTPCHLASTMYSFRGWTLVIRHACVCLKRVGMRIFVRVSRIGGLCLVATSLEGLVHHAEAMMETSDVVTLPPIGMRKRPPEWGTIGASAP